MGALLDEFAFHHETAIRGTRKQQTKSSGAFELLQLAGAANYLPHSIVQQLRLAVRPGHEHRMDNPFYVRVLSEYSIRPGIAS
jgi:hypothetical protein